MVTTTQQVDQPDIIDPTAVNQTINTTTTGGTDPLDLPDVPAIGDVGTTPVQQNIEAVTGTVDPNATVSGQMEGLLSSASPYRKLAEQKSREYANERGLLNTSMAAGAGTRAAIEASLPIAQQDANTYNTQSLTNQAAENQFGAQTHLADLGEQVSDNKFTRDMATAGYGAQIQNSMEAASQLRALEQMAAQQGMTLQQLAAQQGYSLEQLQEQAALQETASAADQIRALEQMATQQGMTLEQMAEQQGYDITQLQTQADIQETLSAADQIRTLEQMATQQGLTLEQMAEQQGYDLAQLQEQGRLSEELEASNQLRTLEQMAAQQNMTLEQAAIQQGYNLATLQEQAAVETEAMQFRSDLERLRASDAQAYQLEILGVNHTNQAELMGLESSLKEQLAALQQDYAIQLETLKNNYIVQANLDTTMGSLYGDTLKSLASFLNSPDLTATQQNAGATTIIGNMEAGLEFLAGITTTPGITPY